MTLLFSLIFKRKMEVKMYNCTDVAYLGKNLLNTAEGPRYFQSQQPASALNRSAMGQILSYCSVKDHSSNKCIT